VAGLADLLHQRVLTLDIERLPGLAPVWDQKTNYIPAASWRRLPSLLCFAANWYGRRDVMFSSVWADGREGMAQAAWDMLDKADVIVTFNGKRFDLPHLKGEFATLGMPPPSPWRNVDLYQIARPLFGYESKSLAHLCLRLGVPGKRGRYDLAQAEAAVSGDIRAQAALTRYNKADVRATKAAYDAMRPWITNHPHIGQSTETLTCPSCGSTDLEPNGSYRAMVMEYAAYRCRHCKANVRAGHVRRVARTRGVRDV
jgi:hypothetical protein